MFCIVNRMDSEPYIFSVSTINIGLLTLASFVQMSRWTWTHMNRRAVSFNGICTMTTKKMYFWILHLKMMTWMTWLAFVWLKQKRCIVIQAAFQCAVFTFSYVSSDMWVAISQSMSIAIVFDGGRAVCARCFNCFINTSRSIEFIMKKTSSENTHSN